LTEGQRLMIYCVQDLVDKLASQFPVGFKVEVNQIPDSEARLIAIFSRDESLTYKKKL